MSPKPHYPLFEVITTAINMGRTGRLSAGLLDPASIQQAETLFLDHIETSTMKTVDRLNLYETDMTIFYNSPNSTLYLRFYIPLMPREFNLMCLFRYAVHPQFFEKDGIIAELVPQKEFLALDLKGKFHKELSIGDLAGCTHVHNTRYCSTSLIENGPDTCLAALNFDMPERAAELCNVILHKKDPFVYQYNQTHYGVYALETTPYTVTCIDDVDPNDIPERAELDAPTATPSPPFTRSSIKGFNLIVLNPGCTLHISTYMAVSSSNIQTFINSNWTSQILNEAWQLDEPSRNDLFQQFKTHPAEKLTISKNYLQTTYAAETQFKVRQTHRYYLDGFMFFASCLLYVYLLALILRAVLAYYFPNFLVRFCQPRPRFEPPHPPILKNLGIMRRPMND